jgi:hypothetical protein
MTVESTSMADDRRRTFQLQEIQTAPLGLMDGSVSTLAPIFATAGLTGRPLTFFVELTVSLGTAINKGGAVRRRKRYRTRQPAATWYNNGLRPRPRRHAPYLPFLIPNLGVALKLAYAVVVCELLTIVFIRCHFICGKLASTIVQVIGGGGIVFAIGGGLGRIGAG